MSVPVVILAGGRATRLGSTTAHVPKSLVDIDGQPFAAHQIALLCRHGLNDIVFLVGHLGEMIRDTLGDGRRWSARLRYVFDGSRALGTGGAVLQALPNLAEPFFVLYGDSYLECDYAAIERALVDSGRNGLMTVSRNDDRWDRSNVRFADGVILSYDKQQRAPEMHHIDYGLGAFRKAAFGRRRSGDAFDLADVYRDLLARGDLAAFEAPERFYEIGSPAGLEETRAHLKAKTIGCPVSYTRQHLEETIRVAAGLDVAAIENVAAMLADLRARGGRLFFVGVGGSAANCSHAVNDFRKIAGIEAYTPADNVSELTARTNDDGWRSVFVEWLKGSRLQARDMLFVFSVGGGDLERNISANLVLAMQYACRVGARIVGIVGRDGGYTATVADACVIVPTVNADSVTPHTEAFQAVIWHLLVSHPLLKAAQTKWESTDNVAAPSSSTETA